MSLQKKKEETIHNKSNAEDEQYYSESEANFLCDANSQASNQSQSTTNTTSGTGKRQSSASQHLTAKQQQQRHKGNCVCLTCVNKYKYLTATGQLVGQQHHNHQPNHNHSHNHAAGCMGNSSSSSSLGSSSSSASSSPTSHSELAVVNHFSPQTGLLSGKQKQSSANMNKRKIDRLADNLAHKKRGQQDFSQSHKAPFNIKNLLHDTTSGYDGKQQMTAALSSFQYQQQAQQAQYASLLSSQAALFANFFPGSPVSLLGGLFGQQQQTSVVTSSPAVGSAFASLLANPNLLAVAMAAQLAQKAQPAALNSHHIMKK